MTKKQLELLRFIEVFININGYAPSFLEMMQAVGQTSKSGIFRLLVSLEEQGKIRRLRQRSRSIELVKDPTLPLDLAHVSDAALANEARRRYLTLCHRERDALGEVTYRPVVA